MAAYISEDFSVIYFFSSIVENMISDALLKPSSAYLEVILKFQKAREQI